jgi:DNA-binding winged helix-turn-helix (wHTH) protein/tetratricopeptide (TPR) repeat protein
MNKNNDMEPMSYSFSDYFLDVDRRELSRNGTQIDLQPRVFDLLVYLVSQHERVVDKDELQDVVWPGMVVTETALTRAVMKVRKAVGDDAATQSVIKTVHGHGYRFVAGVSQNLPQREREATVSGPEAGPIADEHSVSKHALPEALQKRRWPWLLFASMVVLISVALGWRHFRPAAPVEGEIKIAVLPLKNETGNPDLDWISLGLMSFASQLLQTDAELTTVSDGSIVSLADSFDWNGSLEEAASSGFLDRLGRVFGASHTLSMELIQDGNLLRMNYVLLTDNKNPSKGTMVAEEATELVKGVVQGVYGLILNRSRLGAVFPLISADPFNNEAFARGMSLSLEGRCAEAVKYFRVILEQETDLFAPRFELAACLRILGQAEEAETLLLQLIEEQQALGDSREQAQSLMTLGILYNRTGRLEEAERTHRKALKMSQQIDDPDLNARILQNLAILAKNTSDLAGSAELLDLALLEYQRSGREILPGQIYSAQANLKMEQGELVEADIYLKQALKAFRDIGDRRNEAMMLNNTGYLRRNQGLPDEAEDYIMQSLSIREEIGDRVGVGRNYGQLSGLYSDRGDFDLAQQAAEQALSIAQETSDRLFEATSQSQLGNIAKSRGDSDRAREHYLAGRDIFENINDRMRFLQSELKLATLELEQGSYSLATDSAIKVMQESRQLELIQPEVEAMELLGDIALAQNKLAIAGSEYEAALKRLRESSWSGKENVLLIKYASVLLDSGETEAASPLIGALSQQEDSLSSLEVQARFSFLGDDAEAAVKLMERARGIAGDLWTDQNQSNYLKYQQKAGQ